MDLNIQNTKGMSAQTYNETILALQFSENHQFTCISAEDIGGGERGCCFWLVGWFLVVFV